MSGRCPQPAGKSLCFGFGFFKVSWSFQVSSERAASRRSAQKSPLLCGFSRRSLGADLSPKSPKSVRPSRFWQLHRHSMQWKQRTLSALDFHRDEVGVQRARMNHHQIRALQAAASCCNPNLEPYRVQSFRNGVWDELCIHPLPNPASQFSHVDLRWPGPEAKLWSARVRETDIPQDLCRGGAQPALLLRMVITVYYGSGLKWASTFCADKGDSGSEWSVPGFRVHSPLHHWMWNTRIV